MGHPVEWSVAADNTGEVPKFHSEPQTISCSQFEKSKRHTSSCNKTKEKRAQLNLIKTAGLPGSTGKILWQAVLLMYSSSQNIRTVIWQFCCKRSRTRSTFSGVLMADGRPDLATSSVVSSLSRKRLCHLNTRARENDSPPTLAVLSCKFQWNYSQASHKTQYSIFVRPAARLNCPRKRPTLLNLEQSQSAAMQVWPCRNSAAVGALSYWHPWQQTWPDIPGLSAIHSVSELSGHRLLYCET